MKKITFLIKVMSGGGAERVVTLLSNAFVNRNYHVTLIITHQKISEAKLDYLAPDIKVIALENEVTKDEKYIKKIKMFKTRLLGKFDSVVLKKSHENYLIGKYKARNHEKIRFLKKYFSQYKKSTVLAFLYDSIYLTLLSANVENRVIISERGDPRQCLASKTNVAFFKTMFDKADEMIFQSPDAMKWYRENTNVKGKVIFNPVKPDLPERYIGDRKKKIVNFCRISSQKNLFLLVNAFALFAKEYPEYELYIYGDAVGNGAEGYIESVNEEILQSECTDRIHILPAQQDIHNLIKDYAMFVSSSDFEGMSNSMLEAMAIGLPTICTDCPAGGARAIIKDHENGILVPVNDVKAMYQAMKEVADNPELAEKLSINGTKIREGLSVDRIVNQWMEIING